MNNRINSRNLPKCIKQLAKEGYTIDIEHSNKLIRITLEELVMELSVFKSALRGEDKIAFDKIPEYIRIPRGSGWRWTL